MRSTSWINIKSARPKRKAYAIEKVNFEKDELVDRD